MATRLPRVVVSWGCLGFVGNQNRRMRVGGAARAVADRRWARGAADGIRVPLWCVWGGGGGGLPRRLRGGLDRGVGCVGNAQGHGRWLCAQHRWQRARHARVVRLRTPKTWLCAGQRAWGRPLQQSGRWGFLPPVPGASAGRALWRPAAARALQFATQNSARAVALAARAGGARMPSPALFWWADVRQVSVSIAVRAATGPGSPWTGWRR